MSKVNCALAKEWDELVSQFPDDLEGSAKEYGALLRHRKIESASDLLRMVLIYAIVLSLRLAVIWGVGLNICNISRQDLQKRVHNSTAWLRHLLDVQLSNIFETPTKGKGLINRVILRDASTISRPGSPGTEWRVHLSWSPFAMQPAQVTLTDEHSGEGLEDAQLREGDLVIGDRAYGIWRTVREALEALAHFIIRLTWSNLPLLTPDGETFNLIAWLRSLPETKKRAEAIVVAADDPQKRPLRLVAGRLPPDKARAAREKVRRQARKNGREPNPNTLLAAGFCILLTNLPVGIWTAPLVLAFYRIRWQIEWCFRRWKSLCHLDELPSYPSEIAETVLLAKLIIVLLMQKRLDFLPWRDWWAAQEPAPVVSPVVTMIYNRICEIIRPTEIVDQLLEDPQPFLRHLRSSHRERSLQLADATRRFAELYPDLIPAPT
jgi:hypothetical protein